MRWSAGPELRWPLSGNPCLSGLVVSGIAGRNVFLILIAHAVTQSGFNYDVSTLVTFVEVNIAETVINSSAIYHFLHILSRISHFVSVKN
jgi:hypothetical protein